MSDGTISLYFGLKEGENADLEVVAQAALEWVDALRVAARALEPDAQIRVELIDADESSLRLNAVLDWMENQLARLDDGAGRYWRLRKLAIALAIFVPTVGVPTYDFCFGDEPTLELSEEDRQRIDAFIEETRNLPEVETSRRKFFSILERDPSIQSVGVAERRGDPPAILVPGNEFAERSGLWAYEEEESGERTLYRVLEVILISPVLVPRPRAWTFQFEGLPEFKATMKDHRFLAALQEAHVRERLRIGIPMTIRLEIKEKRVDGEWEAKRKGRSVVEVLSPRID